MRGANRVAPHLLQLADTVVLHCVGEGGAQAGMVLMVACALQLYRLAIQEKSLGASNATLRMPKGVSYRSTTCPSD